MLHMCQGAPHYCIEDRSSVFVAQNNAGSNYDIDSTEYSFYHNHNPYEFFNSCNCKL